MKNVLILIVVLFLWTDPASGGGFPTLKLGAGARAGAMGMASTALSDDGSGGYWNPAGLAFLTGKDVLFSLHRWVEDVKGEFLGFGWGGSGTGVGVHVLYTEVGGIEHRVGPSPTPLGTFSTYEMICGVSYAGVLKEGVSVGLTLKMLYEKIFVDEAWGVAADLGILWRLGEEGVRLGGVVQNAGRTGRLRDEDIALPLTGKVGMALPLEGLGGRWVLAVDGVQEQGFPFHLHGGLEYGWRDMLFIRLGYQTVYEIRDVTGGVGVVWKNFRLDYSYAPLGAGFGDSHRFSVGMGW